MENILILNLLGKRIYLPLIIVKDFPETLLGNEELRLKYYRNDRKDYYFERNSLLFSYILTYYTLEKKIFCPHHIPIELLENECRFFQLNDPIIYREINKIETYHYIPKNSNNRNEFLIDTIPFVTGVLFMITTSMETSETTSSSWSLTYFIELFSTLALTSTILYQTITKKNFLRNHWFLIDLFSTILSIFIICSQNLLIMTNHSIFNSINMLLKTFRLFLLIGHLRILRLIIRTFIQRFQTVFILVFIDFIIVGSLSEITFAFERRQKEDHADQLTMKTHLDAFWWATSLSFTIGFGYIDPHYTLTTIGRFCSYMLTFFGLLFNGLILQELIKGFLKISRKERRDQ